MGYQANVHVAVRSYYQLFAFEAQRTEHQFAARGGLNAEAAIFVGGNAIGGALNRNTCTGHRLPIAVGYLSLYSNGIGGKLARSVQHH